MNVHTTNIISHKPLGIYEKLVFMHLLLTLCEYGLPVFSDGPSHIYSFLTCKSQWYLIKAPHWPSFTAYCPPKNLILKADEITSGGMPTSVLCVYNSTLSEYEVVFLI